MAFEMPVLDVSFVAAADLSADQYQAVALDSNGKVVLATTPGQACIGILQNDPRAGETAQVRVYGVSMAKAGAAITAGALVANEASGKVVPATEATANTTTGAIDGSRAIGIALESAAGPDQLISVAVLQLGLI